MKKRHIILIVCLTLITFLLPAAVMFRVGVQGTFYTTDADVGYVSNALRYIVTHSILYNSHPGIPSIVLFSQALLPLRIYTQFIKVDFISWVFLNMASVYHYLRYFMVMLFSLSTGLFLFTIYKNSKSSLTVILACLSLWAYGYFPRMAAYLGPETLSFFLASLWLLTFSIFYKSKSLTLLTIMSAISGVAFANKFTNLALVLTTLLLAYTVPKQKIQQRIFNILTQALVVTLAFVASTLPILSSYNTLFGWVKFLATTTDVHGGGKIALFDLNTYLISVNALIDRDRIPFYIIIITSISVFLAMFRRKIRIMSPIAMVFFGTWFSILVFSKYNLGHYQFVNFIIIVYLASLTLGYISKPVKLILSVLLILPAVTNFNSYYSEVMVAARKEIVLENFIVNNPPKNATVWLWGRSEDFARLWSVNWTGGTIFRRDLANTKPKLLELHPNLEDIWEKNREQKLFDFCWDQLYMQKIALEPFLLRYSDRNLKYQKLDDTDDMYLITSDHCTQNPLPSNDDR